MTTRSCWPSALAVLRVDEKHSVVTCVRSREQGWCTSGADPATSSTAGLVLLPAHY